MTHKLKLITLGIIALIIGGGGGNFLYHVLSTPAHAGDKLACSGTHRDYQIFINDNTASPGHIDAKLCDTIEFTNQGETGVLIAFGEHEDHVAYNGITERMLNKGESFTITADHTGEVKFHDHIHDKVTGDIVVTQ